jgi:predicted nucleotidyltransferase
MSQQELLKKVIQILDETEIEYMITGSIASSLQGEPRSTHDIDIIISIRKSIVNKLVEFFPTPDFYLDKNNILDAIDRQGMFNLIDIKEGDKVDFWMLTDEPFDQSRFSRKYVEEITGIKIQVSSPEDTILAKLRWAKLSGGSEKQFTDALRIYEVQYIKLDMDYLEYWVKNLSIEALWEQLRNEAQTID